MRLSPIIERELRRATRYAGPTKHRLVISVIAVVVCGVFILAGGGGQFLHEITFFCALILIYHDVIGMTLNLFTEDRRSGNLGLIFLTGISMRELYFAKLGGTTLVASQRLLALVPFLSLPFLLGGVSQEVFLVTVAAIPVVFLFALSVSVVSSIVAKDDSTAILTSMAIFAVTLGATPLLHFGNVHFGDGGLDDSLWLILSPAYGPYAIFQHLSGIGLADVIINLAFTTAMSLGFLTAGGWLLAQSWREQVAFIEPASLKGRLHALIHGDKAWRLRARSWLDRDPFLWLAAHDRQPIGLTWLTLGTISSLWLCCLWMWPANWVNPMNCLLTALFTNICISTLVNYTAGKRLGEDRKSGALEMLLTSPLTAEQIVDGQLEAIKFQFAPIRRKLMLLNLALMVAGLCHHDWNWMGLLDYMVLWTPVMVWAWLVDSSRTMCSSIWISVNCGQPSYAIRHNITAMSGLIIQLVFNFVGRGNLGSLLTSLPSGTIAEMVITIFIALITGLIWSISRSDPETVREKLVEELRDIAQESVPAANDPRFEKWKLTERFGVGKD